MDEGKLNLESMDIAEEKRRELLRLFPEAATEGGKIDFDQLKRALGEMVDAERERYGMNWPGKADCFRLIQSPSTATLLPVREESVRFDETENMIIEGDNLEVLKLLQKGYQGKVKMIYIDPPYNTGNDFIYPDDFADNLKNYLQYTGQVDGEGIRFSTNSESSGRFHSNWLNMMYPRLYLARNLLRADGIIFISCDDHELHNLRHLCDQVFASTNFLTTFIWNTEGHTDNQFDVKVNHEYILVYVRDQEAVSLGHVVDPSTRAESNLWRGFAENSITKNGPRNPPSEVTLPAGFPCAVELVDLAQSTSAEDFVADVKREGFISRRVAEKYQMSFPVRLDAMKVRDSVLQSPCRVLSGWANAEKLRDFIQRGCKPIDDDGDSLTFYLSGRGVLYYRRERTKARNILSVLRSMGTTEKMRSELEAAGLVFEYPKPKELMSYLLRIGTETDDALVLDFFAGSGSLAQAALELNARDKTTMKFILVQLPEATQREDFKTISDITKERLRRVIAINREAGADQGTLSILPASAVEGFRVFKLAQSNFKVWEAHTDEGVEGVQRQMELAVHHILPDRTAEDLFFEILMKSEYPLTAKVERFDAAGVAAYSVKDDELVICVERVVTEEAVNAIVKRKPSKVIFLDEAFSGNDALKTNAKLNFEAAGVKRFETV